MVVTYLILNKMIFVFTNPPNWSNANKKYLKILKLNLLLFNLKGKITNSNLKIKLN